MNRATREQVAAVYERSLEPAEFDRRLRAALANEDDIAQLLELIRWFRGRYPTAKARLDYARRQYLASQRPRRFVRRYGA